VAQPHSHRSNIARWREIEWTPSRTKIEHEKEFSFYVNFDEKQQQFTSPFQSVTRAEITNRACALTYLIFIAITVKETLDIGERERNYKTFSIIPFRIFTKFILQEDIPSSIVNSQLFPHITIH